MLNLKTFTQSSSSFYHQKNKETSSKGTRLILKIRFGTWLLMTLYCLISPAFHFHANYLAFSALILGLALHLHAIFRQIHEAVLAIFHLVNSTLTAVIVCESSNHSHFSMIMLSCGHLALFCVQDYPSCFSFIMVIKYLALHWFYSYKLFDLYEPITDSYRFPAQGLDNITVEWTVSVLIILTALVTLKHQILIGINICKAAKNKADNTNQELTEIKSRCAQNINSYRVGVLRS